MKSPLLTLAFATLSVGRLLAHPADEPIPNGMYAGQLDGVPITARFAIGGIGILAEWTRKDMDKPGALDGEFAAGEFRLMEYKNGTDVSGIWRGTVSEGGETLKGTWKPEQLTPKKNERHFELHRVATFTEITAVDGNLVRARLSVPRFTKVQNPGVGVLNRLLLSELPLEMLDFIAGQSGRPPTLPSSNTMIPEWEGQIDILFTDGDQVSLMTRIHRFEGSPHDGWMQRGTNLRRDGERWTRTTPEEVAAAHGITAEDLQKTAVAAFSTAIAAWNMPEPPRAMVFENLEFAYDEEGLIFVSPEHKRPGTGEPLTFRVEFSIK